MHGIERELGRPVYGLADEMFKKVPLVNLAWSRLGGVQAHPDNAYRLLREQQQLVMVFPEGSKGPGKTYAERYQLRRFGRGGFVQIAMRAGVPIIPLAIVGNEETMPIIAKLPAAGQAARPALRPDHGQHAAARPARRAGARSRPSCASGCSTRSRLDVPPDQPRYSRSRIMDTSEAHPPRHPGRAVRHAPPPPQRVVGLMGRRVLVTGLGSFWGGRVAQALEQRPGRRRDHRARHPRADRRARAHRVRPHRRELLDPVAHRAGHPGRHDHPHVPGGRLVAGRPAVRCTRPTSSAP